MDTATDGQQQLHLLYRDHHGWLQGWLRKRLGDREHAADVAQDTFLRLLVSGRFPGAQESRSYLTQIAERLGVTVSSVQKYMTRAIIACYQVVYEE